MDTGTGLLEEVPFTSASLAMAPTTQSVLAAWFLLWGRVWGEGPRAARREAHVCRVGRLGAARVAIQEDWSLASFKRPSDRLP